MLIKTVYHRLKERVHIIDIELSHFHNSSGTKIALINYILITDLNQKCF